MIWDNVDLEKNISILFWSIICILLYELGQVIWYATFSSSVKQGGPTFIVTVHDFTISIM